MTDNSAPTTNLLQCPACAAPWQGKTGYIQKHELLKCSQCGMLFINYENFTPPDYTDVYHTPEYQDTIIKSLQQTSDWGDFKKIGTYQPFFSNIIPSRNNTLLDIGCGVGRFCRAAYTDGWKVKGIDVSETAIAIGSKDAPFELKCTTLESLAKQPEKFDVITSFEVLEHLTAPLAFVEQVYQLLNDDGQYFCTVPNLDSPSVQTSDRADWLPPIHVLFFSEKSLQALLLRAGFKTVKTGIIWTNQAPEKFGLKKIQYHLRKIQGRAKKPNPLGLWAYAQK